MTEASPLQEAAVTIRPQPGPQEAFLSTTADIAIYGGAAGGGKSFALLLEPLRHFNNPLFGAVIFRRNSTQVRNEGGLWDEACSLYVPLGAKPQEAYLKFNFPSTATVKFAHLEHEKSIYNYQGAQIPLIGFDELTHFSENQFFYMLSRNRSMSGISGYVRATCNPDKNSWVRKFIDWYIGEDGYAIPERGGVIRWFVRIDNIIHWGDTSEELIDKFGADAEPKSFTFIPSTIHDNKILLAKNPGYIASLKALSRVERERLLGGNWDVKEASGAYFQQGWFHVLDTVPGGWIQCVRFWDRAATKPNEKNTDPDWTRGVKLFKYPNGTFLVADIKSIRDTPGQVETLIKNVASYDTRSVRVVAQRDPGSAGVSEAANFTKLLVGYDVHVRILTKDKITRALGVSAQCEAGNIFVLRAPWNDEFFNELEDFPDGAHDDIVDALSGAFNEMSGGASILDVL